MIQKNKTVGMVSLGCAKNQVDAERMITLMKNCGYTVTPQLDELDAVVINTCGFIESAKSEAIETILEFCALKAEGKLKKVIVTGCLAERYKSELLEEMPEIDGVLGTGSFQRIAEALDAAFSKDITDIPGSDHNADEAERTLSTPQGWAYLKIAEGCDNRCAYCVIPNLRGAFRSRTIESLTDEAKSLAVQGVRELDVVAQDTTRYGLDLYGRRALPELLEALTAIDGIEWIRLHYLYPDEITDELIGVISSNPKIVKYLDIPIQHINDSILARMNRRGTGGEIRALLRKLRENISNVVIRTTVIAGLPGETEREFEELCDFLREFRLERVGAFPFSPEEGTPAEKMTDRVHLELAEHRAALIEQLQSGIMDEFNTSRLNTVCSVLIEGYDKWGECYYGHSWAEAPDVDGKIFIAAPDVKLKLGDIISVRIIDIIDGDLLGEVLD
ncbi:MAG: 30S ribosomal protein S12 methylthiotransferase RimO [Oscillospiraceae bacterium]|jgi:ribosomal protein S12 methylthiotransferase|nr:30S ribosomal protein S12 methylthiotransferase RimO [Oscillospiraceae bacterium]